MRKEVRVLGDVCLVKWSVRSRNKRCLYVCSLGLTLVMIKHLYSGTRLNQNGYERQTKHTGQTVNFEQWRISIEIYYNCESMVLKQMFNQKWIFVYNLPTLMLNFLCGTQKYKCQAPRMTITHHNCSQYFFFFFQYIYSLFTIKFLL